MSNPFVGATGEIPLGRYELPRRSGEAHLYRLQHPLAQQVLRQAKDRTLASSVITFDCSGCKPKISALEPYIGQSGGLLLSLFTVESLDQAEDYLLLAAVTGGGEAIEEETARRLFSLPVISVAPVEGQNGSEKLQEQSERQKAAIQRSISERNARYFEAEAEKLDNWADDLKLSLEREIKDLDRQIKEARRAATLAPTLEEKLAGQKQIKALESQRNGKRRSLFDAQDEIDKKREGLICEIEDKLKQHNHSEELFMFRWGVC